MDSSQRKRLFDTWIRTHRGILFKIVRAYATRAEDRDDLFQEIAFQIWKSIPRYREDSAVTTWVYRVALYSAIAWSRKERGHGERRRSLAEPELVPALSAEDEDPRLGWLYGQIASLEPVARSLILLHLDGLSYREIADTLGISETNVGAKLSRIRRTLVDKMKETEAHEV